jgi:hypothetical protein
MRSSWQKRSTVIALALLGARSAARGDLAAGRAYFDDAIAAAPAEDIGEIRSLALSYVAGMGADDGAHAIQRMGGVGARDRPSGAASRRGEKLQLGEPPAGRG